MITTEQAAALFAPTGTLRASINIGNPVLARRNVCRSAVRRIHRHGEGGGAPGVGIEFIVFDFASQSVDAVANGRADVVLPSIPSAAASPSPRRTCSSRASTSCPTRRRSGQPPRSTSAGSGSPSSRQRLRPGLYRAN